MNSSDKVKAIVKTLDSKKAMDIKILKVDDLTIIADYFIIATGTSSTHVKSLADEVDYVLSQNGIEPDRREGYSTASWILLDYNSVVVHVFYEQTREFYDLERLWSDGEQISVEDILKQN